MYYQRCKLRVNVSLSNVTPLPVFNFGIAQDLSSVAKQVLDQRQKTTKCVCLYLFYYIFVINFLFLLQF